MSDLSFDMSRLLKVKLPRVYYIAKKRKDS
jgi:hypothetical protein